MDTSQSTTHHPPSAADPMTIDSKTAQTDATVKSSISDLLVEIGESTPTERMTIGDLTAALEDRAFGFLLLILAIPCCIPFLYGVPQAVSLPLVFVAAQIIIGRHRLWLPDFAKKRSFTTESFRNMATRARPYLRWFEVFSKPRLTFLTIGPAERILGVFILVFSASIMIPLPGTNTVPGFAVALMALGFIEKDGILMILGTIVGSLWILMLATVGTAALGVFSDWLTGLF